MIEVVAEISGNHGGSLEAAFELIRQAKWAGADTVKFQCFEPERLAKKRSSHPEIPALAGGKNLVDLYRQTHTPKPWFPKLVKRCQEVKINWFSSVFDTRDVDFLEEIDCPRYKISAFEMFDWELLKAVQETGKPYIVSVRPTKNVTILHASDYDGSFRTLGVSSHSNAGLVTDPDIPMVEWHLKLHDVKSPDNDFSMDAIEMKKHIEWLRR